MAAGQKTLDMTTGSPLKAIAKFAGPVIASNLFLALYNICDSIIVGRFVGTEALAAVGATTFIIYFFNVLSSSILSAVSVLMSQHFGAKEIDMVRRTTVVCIYITVALSVILCLAGLFLSRPIMILLQAAPEILDDAALYLQICTALGFGNIVYVAASSVLRAVGDSRTPLYFLLVSGVLNVVLNVVFVVGFRLEVLGVAAATVISQILSAIACLLYIWKKHPIFHFGRRDLRPDWALIRKTVILGISLSAQGIFPALGDVVISSRINYFGTATTAAFTTVNQIHRFAIILFLSIANAFLIFVGQNYGARLIDRLKRTFRKVLLINIGLGALSAVLIALFGRHLIALFLDSADPNFGEVMTQAREYQLILSTPYSLLAIIWLYNYVLQGMGLKLYPLLSSLGEIICKVLCAVVLSMFIGTTGIWVGTPIGWVFGILPPAIYYYSGRWERNLPDPQN